MKRRKRGFTLIEMIVAGFILSFAIVAAIGAFTTITRANSKAEVLQTSALLAQQRFSELEQQADSLSGGDQQGDFGEDYPAYRWQQSVESTDFTGLFKVTLVITWGSGGAPEEHVYTTFIRNDQNTTDLQIQQQQQNSQQTGTGSSTGGQ
jgi:prepilin-type N-terminal cleavage/methylation domain-containing protein